MRERSTVHTERGESDAISLEVVTDAIQFGCLREEWDQITEGPAVTPFQSFDWSYLWWRHLGGSKGRSLHICVFRRGDTVLGIAPLFLDTRRSALTGEHRRLRFLGVDIADSPVSAFFSDYPLTDYLDFVVRPGFEEVVADAAIRTFGHQRSFDVVEFVSVRSTSFVATHLLPMLEARGIKHLCEPSDVCPQIVLESGFESYLQGLDANHRRRLRQAKRASETDHLFSIRTTQSLDEAQTVFAELVRLHQQRWNKLGLPGLFYDGRFEQFQSDVLKAFYDRGWLWIGAAIAGPRTIAARVCFRHGSTMYDYLSGVDDEGMEAKRRPGLALLVAAMEETARHDTPAVDMLRGGEQYKMQLATEVRHTWNVTITGSRTPVTRSRSAMIRLSQLTTKAMNRIRREGLIITIMMSVHGISRGLLKYAAERGKKVYALLPPLLDRKTAKQSSQRGSNDSIPAAPSPVPVSVGKEPHQRPQLVQEEEER